MHFDDFQKIIRSELGIQVEESQVKSAQERLLRQGWSNGEVSLKKIAYLVKYRSDERFYQVVDLLTVHETYFFREYNQLEVFANQILNSYAERKIDKSIRILSAGCSNGEEAYTLAIILQECLDQKMDFDLEVVGIDISLNCVEKARQGNFGRRSISKIPKAYFEKYFYQNKSSFTILKEKLPSTQFVQGSLWSQEDLRAMGKFDFIFCRNVLIYFSLKEREDIISYFREMLYPQGRLFLGHSENLNNIETCFQLADRREMPIYKRVS